MNQEKKTVSSLKKMIEEPLEYHTNGSEFPSIDDFPPSEYHVSFDRSLNPADQAIEELNRNHALVLVGPKALVLRETTGCRGQHEIQFLSMADMRTYFANFRVPIGADGNKKMAQVADLWLKSAHRRTYAGVTFAPNEQVPEHFYNLWQGYTVQPLEASLLGCGLKCRRLLSHMKYNLCRGSRKLFRYLLAWLADMFNNPNVKPGVALVMRGPRGTGKSKLGETVRYLLGRHAIKISHSRHLVGNFNRHLADKLLIVAEESFWSGDRAAIGPLQDLITSETQIIEAKGVDPIEMPSVSRIMLITNDDWAVPAASDERRYFVLDVGDRRAQDHAYFAAIDNQMKSHSGLGYRALLGLLLRFDLSSVNLRAVPETPGLKNQRMHSLSPVSTFLLDSLLGQHLAGVDWMPGAAVKKEIVYKAFIEHARSRGKIHLPGESAFSQEIIKSLGVKTRRGKRPARPRMWLLPRWEDAARCFEKAHKVEVFAQCSDWKRIDE